MLKFITHSAKAQQIALSHGWCTGARYTNLRDVRRFDSLGFLDIEWKRYDFHRHLRAAIATKPFMTVAQDIEDITEFNKIIDQAFKLLEYSSHVIIVPKDVRLSEKMHMIPRDFLLGYSVPTRYAGTSIEPIAFDRPVHLLGGRPDVQRQLGDQMQVASIDGNRFTLDAKFGDYFDGKKFKPHPIGGYEKCIEDSILNIGKLWDNYEPAKLEGRAR